MHALDLADAVTLDSDRDTWTLPVPDRRDVTIRAAGPPDTNAIGAMHRRCSVQTLRRRYFTAKPDLTPRALLDLATNDDARLSLIAVASDGAVIGHAGLRLANDGTAHAAILVEDAQQSRGVGAALVGMLATVAQNCGVREVHGWTQADNWRLFGALVRAGVDAELRYEEERPVVVAALPQPAVPCPEPDPA